jgi:hypothetical protein
MQTIKKKILPATRVFNSEFSIPENNVNSLNEIFSTNVSDPLFPFLNLEQSSIDQKIFEEKRKRNQAYRLLDYQLSLVSYFDFFSHDAFLVAKQSKYLAYIYGKNKVDLFILLLSLLSAESSLKTFLEEFQITPKKVSEMILERKENAETRKMERELNEFSTETISFQNFLSTKNRSHFWKSIHFHFTPLKRLKNFFKKGSFQLKEWTEELEHFLGIHDDLALHEDIVFSREVSLLFEKASENALLRFKTPVITSEILFLTFLEAKNSGSGKILQEILPNSTEWYLLRYRLLKQLHASESVLRSEVVKNQHFFAYLLKTQLREKEYQKLIETQLLAEGVSYFRNNLIQLTMKSDLHEILSKDIYKSIRQTSRRRYSK